MKEFTIDEHIFKTSTVFLIGCSSKEFQKRLKRLGGKTNFVDGYICGTVIPSSEGYFRIVWVEDKKDIGGIIHELTHLVVRICNDKGVPIKANIETGDCGDETFAYLMEFYTNQIIKKLK
jgi:hypothetical protein